jgi:asparagine synthase (glutamine-hydrolysing)
MAIFAGFARFDGLTPPEATSFEISGLLSRDPSDQVLSRTSQGCLLTWVNLGFWGGASHFTTPHGSYGIIAGNPLIRANGHVLERQEGIYRLGVGLDSDTYQTLLSCHGSYCGVLIQPERQRLLLISDKLRTRPIYFAIQDSTIVFSSALRILENISWLRKSLSIRGAAELAAFQFPLSDHTIYSEIRTAMPGETIVYSRSGSERRKYWNWSDLRPRYLDAEELERSVYSAFCKAVGDRLGTQRKVFTCLSGGMDTRCINSTLRDHGTDVVSINVAANGTQERIFSRKVAQALRTTHFEYPDGGRGAWNVLPEALLRWKIHNPDKRHHPERASLVWTGDGGSTGLGHVYLNEAMVTHGRNGDIPALAQEMMGTIGGYLPKSIFRRDLVDEILRIPRLSIERELSNVKLFDGGRLCHLFVVLNYIGRGIWKHYEDLDIRRYDLVMPFLDTQFLETIFTAPPDGFLRHRFYSRFIARFSPPTTSVPWQTYPGHEPCPLPIPEELKTQWQDEYYSPIERKIIARQKLETWKRMLSTCSFPTHILSRPALLAGFWLTRLRVQDYSYMLTAAMPFALATEVAHGV